MNTTEHLLVILMEECNELAQQASKALRFGLDEQRDLPTSNRERMQAEWSDLRAVVEMLQAREIMLPANSNQIKNKKEKVLKYMNYSRELGTLTKDKEE